MNDTAPGGVRPVLELVNVGRHFVQGTNQISILDGANFTLQPGETVALVAPSGTGKSTLLHLAGLLERPDEGDVIIDGEACGQLSDDRRTAIRRSEIGFVYQFHHLLPEFTALENIMMPQLISGLPKADAKERAAQLLDYMRIGHRGEHLPSELSGGEQQRVAIARAVANAPLILMADEPTGNLDQATGAEIIELMFDLHRRKGATLVLITHDEALAARCHKIVRLRDGLIESVETGAAA